MNIPTSQNLLEHAEPRNIDDAFVFQLLLNSVISVSIIHDRGKWPILFSVCLISIFCVSIEQKVGSPAKKYLWESNQSIA